MVTETSDDVRFHKLPAQVEFQGATLTRLGTGRYCTAYRDNGNPSRVVLHIAPEDCSKEILASIDSVYLPHLKRLGSDGDYTVWETEYLEPLRAVNKEAWTIYKALYPIAEEAWIKSNRSGHAPDVHVFNSAFADVAEKHPLVPRALSTCLRELADAACNYGDYKIEISKTNCRVKDGRLILTDPLFNYAEVVATHRRRAAQRHY